MILYAYCKTFRVTTKHTPFQLVHGFYPLMPTEYMLPMNNSHPDRDLFPTRLLINYMVLNTWMKFTKR